MTVIPEGFAQYTVNFAGVNVPNGAAMVVGCSNDLDLTANQIAEQAFGVFALAVPDMCTSDVSLVSVDAKLGPNETGGIGSFSATAVPGAVGGTSLSPGSAILVEKITDTGGRRGRGRMYWPGVYDGWVDDNGALGSGIAAQVNGFMSDLREALILADIPPYLFHSPSYTWAIVGGQPRRVYDDPGTVPAPYPVTSLVADAIIATQRRRLR